MTVDNIFSLQILAISNDFLKLLNIFDALHIRQMI